MARMPRSESSMNQLRCVVSKLNNITNNRMGQALPLVFQTSSQTNTPKIMILLLKHCREMDLCFETEGNQFFIHL